MDDSKKAVSVNPDHQISMLAGMINRFRLVWLLFQDSRVSMWVKSVLPLSLIYALSPLDFIPDMFLGVGQLDDLGVILLGITLFVKLAPPEIVQYYQNLIEYGQETPLPPNEVENDESIESTIICWMTSNPYTCV
jgi:uncharacterized membrane protein YkvA (DUF1232 family)